MEQKIPRSRLFTRLALATALLTLGLIVLGAVVRVTDSGLGCGNHWPTCNGSIFPPLDNLTAWIEWLHRLFAILIGVFGVGMLVVAIRAYRKQNTSVLGMTVTAALLYTFQSALGAVVVKQELHPTLVTLHLATAMLLLGALLAAAVLSTYHPQDNQRGDGVTNLAYVTTAISFVIILSGALVRGSGATLACVDWPLCNGEILPFAQGQLATLHMFHRLAVLALGISLAVLVWYVMREGRKGIARTLALAALVTYLVQAGVGALFVMSSAAPLWGAIHVGLAATTWSLLLVLSVIEWLGSRPSDGKVETQWNPQSKQTG
jgi:heme A synthase